MDTKTSLFLFAGALAANSQIAGVFVAERTYSLAAFSELFTPAILLGCAFISLTAAFALTVELKSEKSD